ncbi:UNKNOWN [Stylonychia lemnae]|uniref:Uncharacterized protein n=1 Tax=Stylonychia lemnae TaxID=5949 RepID=A0A077ZWI7_STYLE|nr:UNKNOWN [Stylonychia lemnae]|eukprot:CDW72806.1 UNKNOWN [Stylonychia lemnae]
MQFESSPVVSSVPVVQDFFADVLKIFSSIPIEYYKYSSIILACLTIYEGIILKLIQNASALRSSHNPTLEQNAARKFQEINTKEFIMKEIIPNIGKIPFKDLQNKLRSDIEMEDIIFTFFVFACYLAASGISQVLSSAVAPFALYLLFLDKKTLAKSSYYSKFLTFTNIVTYALIFLVGSQAILYPLALQLFSFGDVDNTLDFFTLLQEVFQPIMSQVFLSLLPITGTRAYLKMAKTTSGSIF